MTAIAQVGWKDTANGSLIERDGVVVGSELIGQNFVSPQYFHPRPSAAGAGYDGAASSGSNLGPTNPDFLATVEERVAAYRETNGLGDDVLVPVDAVTASASGLDPHISVRNAQLQAPRVAAERGVDVADVLDLVDEHTVAPPARRPRRPGRQRAAAEPGARRHNERVSERTAPKRGSLRIYLGAAPGVGKTFAMLNEGHRRRERGADVVIGVVETHGRKRTAEQIGDLEVVPRKTVEHRGSSLTEMDVDAILRRQSRTSSSSTSSPTPTPPARATRSAGRTSTRSSTPASTSSRR